MSYQNQDPDIAHTIYYFCHVTDPILTYMCSQYMRPAERKPPISSSSILLLQLFSAAITEWPAKVSSFYDEWYWRYSTRQLEQ